MGKSAEKSGLGLDFLPPPGPSACLLQYADYISGSECFFCVHTCSCKVMDVYFFLYAEQENDFTVDQGEPHLHTGRECEALSAFLLTRLLEEWSA